ncbi:MAG: glycoside hydrolase family 15 protein [Roseiarcus sp.]
MTQRPSLDLAVIGNSTVAAFVDSSGRMVWGCWPRLDGDPIFSALIDGGAPDKGFFAVAFDEESSAEPAYLRNTAIVRTVVSSASGASFAITDFAPQFWVAGRMHRPPMLVRRVEPITGLCRVRVQMRPATGYGRARANAIPGSNHISYVGDHGAFRLTTDAPVSYVVNESGFVLTRPITFILHTDETLPDAVDKIGADFEQRTREYWLVWVRMLNVPFEWQQAVIRASITLQLCSFSDTGAIVAALTTSIPEAPGSERNWDYRYCWIRDAYFTVQALNRVGASRIMERFIEYITNVIAMERRPTLKPVYALAPEERIDERIVTTLAGYRGHGPVRVGNAAVAQEQHDVYGAVILAASQMFYDERLPNKGDKALFDLLEPLGMSALSLALTSDAGIWEYRGRQRVHTYSAAMCWAACDRLARIAERLGLASRAEQWAKSAASLRETILSRAWNAEARAFCGSLDGDDFDACMLLLHELGIVAPTDPRFVATVDTIGRRLGREGGLLLRYDAPDDFGAPTVAFTVCTFWYVDALAAIGRTEEARAIFEKLLARRNSLGLLSEDIDPATGELWGNFPQTYSLVGLIIAAMRLSTGWERAR